MTKYSAGDKVTIVLDTENAGLLNKNYHIHIGVDHVESHDPAPEPIVWWTNVYDSGPGCNHADQKLSDCAPSDVPRLALIKTTFNPATKQVESEVVV